MQCPNFLDLTTQFAGDLWELRKACVDSELAKRLGNHPAQSDKLRRRACACSDWRCSQVRLLCAQRGHLKQPAIFSDHCMLLLPTPHFCIIRWLSFISL